MSEPVKNKSKTEELKEDAYSKAPPPPRDVARPLITLIVSVLILLWAFNGSKFDAVELFKERGKLFETVGRMMPPKFNKMVDESHYSFPKDVTMTELLLPIPLDAEKAKQRGRWWDNQFPQTIIGATIQTIQMALAGTFVSLLFAFPISF